MKKVLLIVIVMAIINSLPILAFNVQIKYIKSLPELADAITVSEACNLCSKLNSGEISSEKYFIKGYVTSNVTDETTLYSYGCMSFYMADSQESNIILECNQVGSKNRMAFKNKDEILNGDFVIVYGYLTNENGVYKTVEKSSTYVYYSSNELLGSTNDNIIDIQYSKNENSIQNVIEISENLAQGDISEYMYVRGVVKSVVSVNLTNGMASFILTDGDNNIFCDSIYYGYGYESRYDKLREKFISIDQIKNGDTISIYGRYKHFYSTIKVFDGYISRSSNQSNNGIVGGEDGLTVSQAFEIGSLLENNNKSTEIYKIKGLVTKIKDLSAQYGNITIDIADDINNNSPIIRIYRAKYINNTPWFDKYPIEVGDEVTVIAQLENYNGTVETYYGYISKHIVTNNKKYVAKTLNSQTSQNLVTKISYDNKEDNVIYQYESCSLLELTAISDYGYYFSHWSNGKNSNPMQVLLLSDTTIVACFEKLQYHIEFVTSDSGTIKDVSNSHKYLDTCQILAVPNFGYEFASWSDGIKENPRSFILTKDTMFSAIYKETSQKYGTIGDLSVSLVNGLLSISGDGSLDGINSQNAIWKEFTNSVSKINLSGDIKNIDNSLFNNIKIQSVHWNVRKGTDFLESPFNVVDTFLIGENVEYIPSYLCAGQTKINNFVLPNVLTSIGAHAFDSCVLMSKVVIPNIVSTIGDYAFAQNTFLSEVILGANLKEIGCHAFDGDYRIESITSYATITPTVCETAFDGLSKGYIYLYVPEESIRKYQVDPNWNKFDIKTKSASTAVVTNDSVIITPSSNEATFTWPVNDQANGYSLKIKKDGEVFCTLTFNANGQLTGIAFAPSRNGRHNAPAAIMTTNGWQFTVTGLDAASLYGYTLEITDVSQYILQTYTGTFATDGYKNPDDGGISTMIDDIISNDNDPIKFLRDGQLYIQRNGIIYDARGARIE